MTANGTSGPRLHRSVARRGAAEAPRRAASIRSRCSRKGSFETRYRAGTAYEDHSALRPTAIMSRMMAFASSSLLNLGARGGRTAGQGWPNNTRCPPPLSPPPRHGARLGSRAGCSKSVIQGIGQRMKATRVTALQLFKVQETPANGREVMPANAPSYASARSLGVGNSTSWSVRL